MKSGYTLKPIDLQIFYRKFKPMNLEDKVIASQLFDFEFYSFCNIVLIQE